MDYIERIIMFLLRLLSIFLSFILLGTGVELFITGVVEKSKMFALLKLIQILAAILLIIYPIICWKLFKGFNNLWFIYYLFLLSFVLFFGNNINPKSYIFKEEFIMYIISIFVFFDSIILLRLLRNK